MYIYHLKHICNIKFSQGGTFSKPRAFYDKIYVASNTRPESDRIGVFKPKFVVWGHV